MRVIHEEWPEGPVLHIHMQTFDEVDCVGCGKEIDRKEAEWERVPLEGGMYGQQPWCKPCYRKYVGPIEGDYMNLEDLAYKFAAVLIFIVAVAIAFLVPWCR